MTTVTVRYRRVQVRVRTRTKDITRFVYEVWPDGQPEPELKGTGSTLDEAIVDLLRIQGIPPEAGDDQP